MHSEHPSGGSPHAGGSDLTAVIGDVGRHGIRIALSDPAGHLRLDTVRCFDGAEHATFSGALTMFAQERGMRALPQRCAVAVSGIAQGDTIAITHGRRFISRSGLRAMLRAEPLIINDTAAVAWAIAAEPARLRVEVPDGATAPDLQAAGTFSIVAVGSGLGCAILHRSREARPIILPTEAGLTPFKPESKSWQPVEQQVRAAGGVSSAEHLLSTAGLHRTYLACCKVSGQAPAATDWKHVIRNARLSVDGAAAQAVELVASALWEFAGRLVLVQGAWGGVVLTGTLIPGLITALRRRPSHAGTSVEGPYARQTGEVARALVTIDHGELLGAAAALRSTG